jgi:hypothetical protein
MKKNQWLFPSSLPHSEVGRALEEESGDLDCIKWRTMCAVPSTEKEPKGLNFSTTWFQCIGQPRGSIPIALTAPCIARVGSWVCCRIASAPSNPWLDHPLPRDLFLSFPSYKIRSLDCKWASGFLQHCHDTVAGTDPLCLSHHPFIFFIVIESFFSRFACCYFLK